MEKGNIGLLFNKVDTFIFEKVEVIQGSNVYNQYKHFLKDHLDENVQKVLNTSFTLAFMFLPVIVVIAMIVLNTKQTSEYNQYKQINSTIASIITKTSELNKMKHSFNEVSSLNEKTKLQSKVTSVLQKYNASSAKITGIDYRITDTTPLQKATAVINIKHISTEGLLNISKEFINRYKISLKDIKVKRNTKNDSLDVALEVEYFVTN